MPDDVRDRLRAEVRAGVGKPRRTKHLWYAAAAAVVVLAAGAVVATQAFRQQPVAGPPPAVTGGLTLDGRLATAALDRCWAAVQTAGKTDRVPPRADWVPLFTEVLAADSVVAATAAGKPMFCETTETTVTLSDPAATPAYAPGTRTGLLLQSATGLVGGVLDPAWSKASLAVTTPRGSSGNELEASPVSHQFAAFTRVRPAAPRLALADTGAGLPRQVDLPGAPAPLLAVTDRPEPADRTSPAGRALGDCLADADEVVPDSAAYRPGPLLQDDDYQVVTGRRGDRVIVCTREPDYQRPGETQARVYPDLVENRQAPARVLRVSTLGAGESGAPAGKARNPVVVVLPAAATGAALIFGPGSEAEVTVVDGMALAWLPTDTSPDAEVHIQAWDAKGIVVYDGSLRLI
jgi:hypothetical protein